MIIQNQISAAKLWFEETVDVTDTRRNEHLRTNDAMCDVELFVEAEKRIHVKCTGYHVVQCREKIKLKFF